MVISVISVDFINSTSVFFSCLSLFYTIDYRFSRKILWLEVSPTTHDPKVVARYSLETVEEIAGTDFSGVL